MSRDCRPARHSGPVHSTPDSCTEMHGGLVCRLQVFQTLAYTPRQEVAIRTRVQFFHRIRATRQYCSQKQTLGLDMEASFFK